MRTLGIILEKESSNINFIYLYRVGDVWKAFGQSAYYLSLLYPELNVIAAEKGGDKREILENQICIPDEYLLRLSEEMPTLAGDDYIQMEVPAIVFHKTKVVVDK